MVSILCIILCFVSVGSTPYDALAEDYDLAAVKRAPKIRRQATHTLGRGRGLADCAPGDDCANEAWKLENMRDQNGRPKSVEYDLYRALMKGYEKTVRPASNHNDPVEIEVSIFIYQVIKLDQAQNTIKLQGSFELYWVDKFLQWNPIDFNNATEIFLSSTSVWTPEFSQYYSHSNEPQIVVMKTNNDLRLNHTGHLRYYVPFSTEALCPVNVQFFPFDWQICQLYFGSWAHNNASITYKIYKPDNSNNSLQLGDFYDNQEWTLHKSLSNAEVVYWEYNYLNKPESWSVIHVVIVVERTWFYYVFNLVMPSTIIVIVAIIGFHSPSTSSRVRDTKFRLGIMTLMSMSVILLAVVDGMPKFDYKGSEESTCSRKSFSGIPLIGIYYVFLLTVVASSTVSTSVFVFLDRRGHTIQCIPWYLVWLSPTNCNMTQGYKLTESMEVEINGQLETSRAELRSRLSVCNYDNLIVYQYFHQMLEQLITVIGNIESAVQAIRHEMFLIRPQEEMTAVWRTIIRRLELISLMSYLLSVSAALHMFFKFEWWYGSPENWLKEAQNTNACF